MSPGGLSDGLYTTGSDPTRTLAALTNVATDFLSMYMHLTIAAGSLPLAHNAGHSTSLKKSLE